MLGEVSGNLHLDSSGPPLIDSKGIMYLLTYKVLCAPAFASISAGISGTPTPTLCLIKASPLLLLSFLHALDSLPPPLQRMPRATFQPNVLQVPHAFSIKSLYVGEPKLPPKKGEAISRETQSGD